jgi:hypothetical protein
VCHFRASIIFPEELLKIENHLWGKIWVFIIFMNEKPIANLKVMTNLLILQQLIDGLFLILSGPHSSQNLLIIGFRAIRETHYNIL